MNLVKSILSNVLVVRFNSILNLSDPGAWKLDAPCAGSSNDVSLTDSTIVSVT